MAPGRLPGACQRVLPLNGWRWLGTGLSQVLAKLRRFVKQARLSLVHTTHGCAELAQVLPHPHKEQLGFVHGLLRNGSAQNHTSDSVCRAFVAARGRTDPA